MEWNDLVDVLLNDYEKIYNKKNNKPDWAVHKKCDSAKLIGCTIPFVGKEYAKQKTKVLLYASAENLSDYDGYLDCDEAASNRHRKWYEWSLQEEKVFYPNVHIAPMNDGSLLLAAFYLYSKIVDANMKDMPVDFLEKICFANYCKYTIESGKNKDYARDLLKLQESREYIAKDIQVLQPDYIIMPKSIYETEHEYIDGIKGNATIIPIYQTNATTINCMIAKKYRKYTLNELSDVVRQWYDHLGTKGISGRVKESYLAVFSYLDEVIKDQMSHKQ